MAEVTVNQLLETNIPGIEVARITTAASGDTYTVRRPGMGGIQAAFFQPNRANAAADAWGLTYTVGGTQVTINLIGTTAVTGSIMIIYL